MPYMCMVALAALGADQPTLTIDVIVLNFDPILEAEGGKRLHEWARWQDPRWLAAEYAKDVHETSGGLVRHNIVDWRDLDVYPIKTDGFAYDEAEYLKCFRAGEGWHDPDGVDYGKVIDDCGLIDRINADEADEVWMFGAPYFGYWESLMVGPTAYFCNSPPLIDERLRRNFVIMGFNYERGVGEMLEDLGHRTESILTHVYGGWRVEGEPPERQHMWGRFNLIERDAPGEAGCGSVHFAPNSTKDYEWGNEAYVLSNCDDWLDYPNFTGNKRRVNCEEWGRGDIRPHHKWWLSHLPRAPGRGPDGKRANWWPYVMDFNSYPESRGEAPE